MLHVLYHIKLLAPNLQICVYNLQKLQNLREKKQTKTKRKQKTDHGVSEEEQ